MKQSHAEALGLSWRLILCYLAFCLVGTLLFSAVYMIYMLCTSLVAGQAVKAFSFALFVEGVRVLLPLALGFSSMIMALYLTRHQTNTILPVITFLILSMLTWFLIMPAVLNATQAKFSSRVVREQEQVLSPGFFREQGQAVFYYSRVNNSQNASGLLFDTSPDSQAVYTFSDVATVSSSLGFTDSLIGDSVAMPGLLDQILSWYKGLLLSAYNAVSAGYLTWVFYASVGIALCSVLGFCKLSYWRLLNMNAILYGTAFVLIFNAMFFVTDIFAVPASLVASWFKKVPLVKNPFQVLVNVAFALIMLIIAICVRVRERKKRKLLSQQGEESYI